jgi:hypothetical protein
MAAGYAAQDDEAQVQTRIKSIKDLNASEEDWSKAIDSLHGADRISASALSSVLSRLGRKETVKCIDLNHNTPDSFTELARLTLGERDEVEHMIYETLSLTQSHDKALRALGYVEGELIAALGSPEAAEALLKVRPALVVDYVEDPQKFERYCRLLRDHGPVMAQMHLQGALSIHDFSSLEAILRFDERELGRIRSASSAMPVIIRTLHEEAIDLLRELGMPAPVFTYAYLCHGPYRIEGSGKFVPKGLRTKETMYLFKRNPPKRLLADTEKLLLQSGILKADRFDGEATAVIRPDEVLPTNPRHAQVRRIVEIAQQQFKVRMPDLAPDWK